MLKRLIVALAALALVVGIAPMAIAKSQMDFTLVNGTGYTINEVYISPSEVEEWGDNILNAVMPNGSYATVTFNPAADDIAEWDLMVVWDDDSPNTYWRGLTLAEIHKITLKYDREADETSAVIE